MVSPGCGFTAAKRSSPGKHSRIGRPARRQQRRLGARLGRVHAANNKGDASIEAVCLGEGLFGEK